MLEKEGDNQHVKCHGQPISKLSVALASTQTRAERKHGLCHVGKDTSDVLNSEGRLTDKRTEAWEGQNDTGVR